MNSHAQNRLNRTIFIFSILGIVVAVYVLQSFLRQAPIVCINSGCELVRKHPASYLFGIPVPAFGLIGYSILALLSFLRTLDFPSQLKMRFLLTMLGVSLFGVLFVAYFTFVEVFVIRGICTWCALSAVNMIIIFSITFRLMRKERNHSS